MANPTRISDLVSSNPQAGDQIPFSRGTGITASTRRFSVESILTGLLNAGDTSTIDMSFDTSTRTLCAALMSPVVVNKGGTGLTATPTNGQLLIGNSTNFSLNTLSAGAGITIVNRSGAIGIGAFYPVVPPAPFTIDYLIVAGGGGGGATAMDDFEPGTGGGAGGALSATFTGTTLDTRSIVIGSGGNRGLSATNYTAVGISGSNGGNSSIQGIIQALGGGGGGGARATGKDGGSGGGGYSGGQGTLGQGKNGKTGGGGKTQDGAQRSSGAPPYIGTNGGNGFQWLNNIFYAGGGGGGASASTVVGNGGIGGGGNGGTGVDFPIDGESNTGGGGGGAGVTGINNPSPNYYRAFNGANGGSGIVILRYPGSPRATGGSIDIFGGYTFHTFTTSGTFTITA